MTSRYWSAHTATSASVSVPSNHTIFCCAVGLRRFVATKATSRCPWVPHARTVAESAPMTRRSAAAHTSNVAFRRVILPFISAEMIMLLVRLTPVGRSAYRGHGCELRSLTRLSQGQNSSKSLNENRLSPCGLRRPRIRQTCITPCERVVVCSVRYSRTISPVLSPRADVFAPALALSSRGVRLDSETIVDRAS